MGLIAHYRLDGDATDAVGDKHGSVTSAAWADGKLGQAADMRSTNWWITGDGWNITSEFSYSFWAIKTSDSDTYTGGLVGNHYHAGGPTGCNICMANVTSAIMIATGDGVNRPAYSLTVPSPTNKWQHYTLTYKGKTVSVYQNGVHIDSRDRDIKFDTSRPFAIGRWASSYDSYYLNGMIDDVRIYDQALSPREVRDLSLGLMSRYRLYGDTTDSAGTGLISIGSGAFVDSEIGIVADVVGTSANIALEHAPLNLRGETIVFREKCDLLRSDAGGGGFTNHVIQWGTYYGNNSGGFGLQTGTFSYYLKGPSSSGWTDSGSIAAASQRYDLGGWIDYAVVFGEDDTISLYMDGEKVTHFPLSAPYTGLNSAGIQFGTNMLAQVSDVRIYSTALTAAQIKELYQQRVSIDSEGSVHVSQLIEKVSGLQGNSEVAGEVYTVRAKRYPYDSKTPSAGVFKDGSKIVNFSRDWHIAVWDTTTGDWATGIDYYGATSISGIAARYDVYGDRTAQQQAFCNTIDNLEPHHFVIIAGSHAPEYYNAAMVQRILHCGGSSDKLQWTSRKNYICAGMVGVGEGNAVTEVLDNTTAYDDGVVAAETDVVIPSSSLQVKQSLLPSTSSEVGVTRGLVAWYPLIGDTKDYAGTNHATNNGAVATAEGYEFDGVDDWLLATDNVGLSGDAEFSISYLAYWSGSSWSSNWPSGAGINSVSATNRGISTTWKDGRIALDFWSNRYRATNPLTVNTWYFVTFTKTPGLISTTSKLYVNGIEQSGTVEGSDVVPNIIDNPPVVGRLDASRWFNGIIRDVRIHNVALTPEEVALQAKLALGGTNSAITSDCLYTKGQLKEVVA
ncbi:LamG domain-containing protein [uncultured Marinobacter sp.]|uniref:LamG domain-containing protein n=1 Tax=uncultured Marinobacter sp. TaxID=187379 RepID=UPI002594662B|nr:LamG domain-containing protein [uncultured Marinobacter sp.]